MTPNLTPNARVMEHRPDGNHDAGWNAEDYFGDDFSSIQIGTAQGEDQQRGAYEWWPLSLSGKQFGELRDDANGLTVHITNEPHDLMQIL
jgi:hypothetical protein